MNLLMVYDTETSGLPIWNRPSSDPGQPHLVQAAAILVDEDTRKTISSFDLTAKPVGWEIPDDVAAIHGITTEQADLVGVPERDIVTAIWNFFQVADLRVGHNESFDARIMRIGLKRFTADDSLADLWKSGEAECTCNMATPIVKAPPTEKMLAAGRRGPKRANLGEAYEFFTGKTLEEAHTALADTLACMAVYWAIKDQGKAEPATEAKTAQASSNDDGVSFL